MKTMANLLKKTNSARWVFNCRSWRPTEADWLKVSSGIAEEEKKRIGKFVFKRDAKLSTAGRLLIRKFIVDSTDLDWDSVIITRDKSGKPVFQNDNFSLHFNVAHQGNYTVLAGESDVSQVGVDVMKIEYSGGKPLPEFFRIMNRQFSDNEWKTIKSGETETKQLAIFYRLWCLKESYVKATGTGITVCLRDISFKLNTNDLRKGEFINDTELFLKSEKQSDWTFEETLVDEEHCMAVALNLPYDCSRDPKTTENLRFIEFGELIKNLKPITPLDLPYCREFLSKEDSPLFVSDEGPVFPVKGDTPY